MPKQILKIDQFHGGLNSHADPRDIADNQLSALQNASVSSIGRIVVAGGKSTISEGGSSYPSEGGSDITKGYGLFAFSADYDNESTPGNNEKSYLVLWERSTNKMWWQYDVSASTWYELDAFVTESLTDGHLPTFYYIDGALRISDGRAASPKASYWFGYIDRDLFNNTGSYAHVAGWYAYKQALLKPTAGVALGDDDSEVTAKATVTDNAVSIHVRHGAHTLTQIMANDGNKMDASADWTGSEVTNVTYFGSEGGVGETTAPVAIVAREHDLDTYYKTSIYAYGINNATLEWKFVTAADVTAVTFGPGQSVYCKFRIPDGSSMNMWQGAGAYFRSLNDVKVRFFLDWNSTLASATYLEYSVDGGDGSWVVGDYKVVGFEFEKGAPTTGGSGDVSAQFTIDRIEIQFSVYVESLNNGTIPSSPIEWGQFRVGTTGDQFYDAANYGTRNWGYSYIYNGNQESGIFKYADPVVLQKTGYIGTLTVYQKGHVGVGETEELISEENNREFESATGVDWVVYDPEGGNSASIAIDSTPANKIRATTTSDNEPEGAQLPIVNVGDGTTTSVVAGRLYKISVELTANTGTPSVIIGLGGTLTPAFAITASGVTYEKYIVTTNNTGALLIYNTSSSALTIDIDNVSVKAAGDSRVTGSNIYFYDSDDVPYLFAECDFVSTTNGLKLASASNYPGDTAWATLDTDVRESNTVEFSEIGLFSTYESLHGYREDEGAAAGFKASYGNAVLNGRRLIVGPVYIDKNDGKGQSWHNDTMIGTSPGEFDTFPGNARNIDVATEDGDKIMGLATYADRILQFKKNTMYLINITKSTEYLEDTFRGKGVSHPAAIFKTDYGIAWANENGCFFYDGKEVKNLIDMKISDSDWETHMDTNSLVGYHPNSRKIIVTGGGTNNRNAYVFDLVTQSWSYMLAVFDNYSMTNFVNNSSGDLVFATDQSNGLQKWTETSAATSGLSVITKDIDFGQPGQRKKIYKVYVSHKGDANAVTCTYSVNGDTDTVANFFKIGATGATTGATNSTTPFYGSTVGTDDWVLAELKPVASINNVYSFQLIFGGTAAADFEINDISIVYRLKPVK